MSIMKKNIAGVSVLISMSTIEYLKYAMSFTKLFFAEYCQQLRDCVDLSFLAEPRSEHCKENYVKLVEAIYEFEKYYDHVNYDFGTGSNLLQAYEYDLEIRSSYVYLEDVQNFYREYENRRLEICYFIIMTEIFKGRSILFCEKTMQLTVYENAFIVKDFLSPCSNDYMNDYRLSHIIASMIINKPETPLFSINRVILNNSNQSIFFNYHLTTLSKNTLSKIDKLGKVSVMFSDKASIVNYSVFKNCKELELKREQYGKNSCPIDNSAFKEIHLLEKLHFFADYNLNSIYLPQSLISLHIDSFVGLEVENNMFDNLTNLKHLIMDGRLTSIVKIKFHGFCGLVKLEYLKIINFNSCLLIDKSSILFPESLIQLELVNLGRNNIEKSLDSVYSLKNLIYFDISFNSLEVDGKIIETELQYNLNMRRSSPLRLLFIKNF